MILTCVMTALFGSVSTNKAGTMRGLLSSLPTIIAGSLFKKFKPTHRYNPGRKRELIFKKQELWTELEKLVKISRSVAAHSLELYRSKQHPIFVAPSVRLTNNPAQDTPQLYSNSSG